MVKPKDRLLLLESKIVRKNISNLQSQMFHSNKCLRNSFH